MAEFCISCYEKENKIQKGKKRYVLSFFKDLCEGCGEFKRVIIREKQPIFRFRI